MITIKEAQNYSTRDGEMAYAITYSDGTEVRAVEGKGFIRNEYKKNGEWLAAGKPYIVKHNRKRQAERIKENCLKFIRAN